MVEISFAPAKQIHAVDVHQRFRGAQDRLELINQTDFPEFNLHRSVIAKNRVCAKDTLGGLSALEQKFYLFQKLLLLSCQTKRSHHKTPTLRKEFPSVSSFFNQMNQVNKKYVPATTS